MFTRRDVSHGRENGLEDLKMAVFPEFWYFSRRVGNDFSGLLKMRHAAIFRYSAFSPPTGERRR
jgi:hypothetical protein